MLIRKYIFFFLGSLSLLLGGIGILIPVLPTTPFLLLTAFFYLRSSKKMYNWLIYHKIFGVYIQSYLIYKAVTLKAKIGALVFLWLTLGISMFLLESLHIRIFLCLIGIGVTIHLIILKTMSSKQLQNIINLREKEKIKVKR